jgi:type I restriction enzyme, S subunit
MPERGAWTEACLGDLISLEYGSALQSEVRTGQGYPVIGSSGHCGRHDKALIDGPSIVVGRKGTVGSITWTDEPSWPIDTVYWVNPRQALNLRWLYWRLQSLGLKRMEASTGVPGLNRGDAYLANVAVPPEPEQRRIAEILNALDDQISHTKSLIKKLREIRSAMLAQLLLQPGRDWTDVRLREAVTLFSGGTPSTFNPQYWNGDIPWISAASLKSFYIRTSDRKLTSLGVSAGTRLVPRDTIIVVVRGMSLKSEVRIGITQREVAFGQDCKALVAAPGFDPRFLAFAVMAREPQVLQMVDEAGHGTGRLPTDLLSSLVMSMPQLDEQARIASILDSVYGREAASSRIVQEDLKLEKLYALKQGLMDDLLTGRVRVANGGNEGG